MRRFLALTSFWILETVLILGSTVLVLCIYFPLVALKAIWTGVRNIGSRRSQPEAETAR